MKKVRQSTNTYEKGTTINCIIIKVFNSGISLKYKSISVQSKREIENRKPKTQYKY